MRRIVLLLTLLAPAVLAGELVFTEGFEGSARPPTGWNKEFCETWSYNSVGVNEMGAPAPQDGSRSGRFEIRPGDRRPTACQETSTYQAHIASYNNYSSPDSGDWWAGLAVYIPSDWTPGQAIELFRDRACGNSTGGQQGCVYLYADDNVFTVSYLDHFGNLQSLNMSHPINKGAWVEFVFLRRIKTDTSGRIEVWVDGTSVSAVNNGTLFTPGEGRHIKVGVTTSPDVTNIVFFDNLKVAHCVEGEEVDCFELVAPSDSVGPVSRAATTLPPTVPTGVTVSEVD